MPFVDVSGEHFATLGSERLQASSDGVPHALAACTLEGAGAESYLLATAEGAAWTGCCIYRELLGGAVEGGRGDAGH